MIEILALAVVIAAGLFFIALGGASLVTPRRASRFLLGFAGSPSRHYAELTARFLVGGAFVIAAPRISAPGVFTLFGWLLLATTVVLLLMPWHWHHRFAGRAVPAALPFLPVMGVASLGLGGLVLWAVFNGNAA
jgi:hypothetical protein